MAKKKNTQSILKDVNGRILAYGHDISYQELLRNYIDDGHDLRSIDHNGKNLSGFHFPENSDLSGSTFIGTRMEEMHAMGAIFKDCTFYRSTVSGNLKGTDFSDSSIFSTSFKYSNFNSYKKNGDERKTNFFGCVIVDADFDYVQGNSVIFDDATLREVKFRSAHLWFASFKFADVIACTFDNTSLVPEKFSGKEGDKYIKTVGNWKVDHNLPHEQQRKEEERHNANKRFITHVTERFKHANFVGNYYKDVRLPSRMFGIEHKDKRSQERITSLISYGILAGYVGVETKFLEPLVDRLVEAVTQYPLIHTIASHNVVYGLFTASAIGLYMSMDKIQDWVQEGVRNTLAGFARAGIGMRNNLLNAVKDIGNLILLVGNKKSLDPIKAALIATKPLKKREDVTQIDFTKIMNERLKSFFDDDTRIIICDRHHLEHALHVYESLKKQSKQIFSPVVFVNNSMQDGDPVSISVDENKTMRAFYPVDYTDPDADPKSQDLSYKGYVALEWSSKNQNITCKHIFIPRASKEVEAHILKNVHPEFASIKSSKRHDVFANFTSRLIDKASAEAMTMTHKDIVAKIRSGFDGISMFQSQFDELIEFGPSTALHYGTQQLTKGEFQESEEYKASDICVSIKTTVKTDIGTDHCALNDDEAGIDMALASP